MSYLIPFIVIFIVSSMFMGCGGKSDIAGEVVPLGQVCSFEKAKPVAVEGFLATNTMRCERASRKKSAGIVGCTFDVYENSDRTGAKIPVYILKTGWFGGKNNRVENPEDYNGEVVFRDKYGTPLPKKELKIYDNNGNPIPAASKIRVYGTLPNADRCEFSLAQRIEKIL